MIAIMLLCVIAVLPLPPGHVKQVVIVNSPVTSCVMRSVDNSAIHANWCQANTIVTIGEPPLLIATATVTNITCAGLTDGTAVVTVSGGTTPYIYGWSTGATSAALSGLGAGTYGVTVTDGNGCTGTNGAIVNEPDVLNATEIVIHVSSFNNSDGEVALIVAGGTNPYSYLWSNGGTDSLITGLAAGTYIYTVADANGCAVSDSVVITEPLPFKFACHPNVDTVIGQRGVITTITGGYTFSGSYIIQGTLKLKQGTYKLTPGTIFYMSGDGSTFSSTVIEPNIHIINAKFIMNDATITSDCDTMWGSIEVFPGAGTDLVIDGINDSCEISNGYYGLIVDPSFTPVLIRKTKFLNNRQSSVSIENQYVTPSSTDNISNNRFYSHPDSMNYPYHGSIGRIGVHVFGNNNTVSISNNRFENLEYDAHAHAVLGHGVGQVATEPGRVQIQRR